MSNINIKVLKETLNKEDVTSKLLDKTFKGIFQSQKSILIANNQLEKNLEQIKSKETT